MSSIKQFIVIFSTLWIASSINLLPFMDLIAMDEICTVDLTSGESESHDCSNEIDINEMVDVILHNDMTFSINNEKSGIQISLAFPHTIFLAIFSPPPEVNH